MLDTQTIDRAIVLRHAERMIREAAGEAFREKVMPPLEDYRHHGVFVTIHIRGRLRGCIGCLDETMPFAEALRYAATRASTADFRFEAIRIEELRDLECDVTVLERMERITGPEDVLVGTHGVMIECRSRRGLLLPQVASERGWDADTFLRAVCEKAGLSPEALNDPDTVLSRFAAILLPQSPH